MLSTAPSYSYQSWDESEELALGEVYSNGFVACHPQIIVALHKQTRSDTLLKLRKARSKYVRAALAQRPDLDSLPALAQDKQDVVRAAVAGQRRTPRSILLALSLDESILVRTAVHGNPSATTEAKAQAVLLGVAATAN